MADEEDNDEDYDEDYEARRLPAQGPPAGPFPRLVEPVRVPRMGKAVPRMRKGENRRPSSSPGPFRYEGMLPPKDGTAKGEEHGRPWCNTAYLSLSGRPGQRLE